VRQLTAHLGESAERGLRIVRRMLEFSRPTTSGGAFDLAPCLAALAEILGSTLGSQVRVHCAVPPGLPAALADAAEFQTVMLNLAVNARDAMPEGGALRITAAAETREEEMPALDPQAPGPQRSGRYLRVAVADTGSGMSPEVLARVGEAFFTTKPPGKGTGLGLVLARRFAENAGGALHIESEAGRGTTITLWLPATSAPAETMPA
jgi:signal transduction histidine kinase